MAGFKNRINVKTTNNYFERTELLEQYKKKRFSLNLRH